MKAIRIYQAVLRQQPISVKNHMNNVEMKCIHQNLHRRAQLSPGGRKIALSQTQSFPLRLPRPDPHIFSSIMSSPEHYATHQ
jgi:hypothetical protein